MKKYILALTVILVATLDSTAQYRRYGNYGDVNCIICSINVGAGYYSPSMTFLKEESPFRVGPGLTGALTFNASIEGKVIDNLYVGIGAGFFQNSDRFDTTGVGGEPIFVEWEFRHIMAEGYVRYEFDLAGGYGGGGFTDMFHPYIGAGGAIFFMSQKYTRFLGGSSTNNNEFQVDYNFPTGFALLGANFDIVNHLGLGIEGRYYFGGFEQGFENTGIQTISMSGPMVLVKLQYQFFSRVARDLRHGRRRSSRFGRSR